jgi:hypothetical protein
MEIETKARQTETRNSAAANGANSDEKTQYGLGVSRSEVRGVEYKRDWNREEGSLTSLDEKTRAMHQLTVEPATDEARGVVPLMIAAAEFGSSPGSQAANNPKRSINERLNPRLCCFRPGLPSCSSPCRPR